MPAAARDTRSPDGAANPVHLVQLYQRGGLSTYQIAELTGLDRQRVARSLRRHGVPLRPRGAGRSRPTRRLNDPPDVRQLITRLYVETRLSSGQISVLLSMPGRTVRDRLRRYGVRSRSRGAWSREERAAVPAELLAELYVHHGLPVRTRGAFPGEEPAEDIELVEALYADSLVAGALRRYGLARVPAGGPIQVRFPVPVTLTTPLVKDLYWGCGIGLNHIELLTVQPAMTVRGFMRRSGIPLRHPGGRTPFMRRWRASGRQPSIRPR